MPMDDLPTINVSTDTSSPAPGEASRAAQPTSPKLPGYSDAPRLKREDTDLPTIIQAVEQNVVTNVGWK